MESDMVGFQPFRQTHEVSKEPDPLEFLVSNDISEHEVGDKLDPILLGGEVQDCPVCGESMMIRKANKGKSAGSIFWVCNDFLTCRCVIKA